MSFELPYALDEENRLISQERGSKGALYSCPGCREKVLFRQGDVRIPHFSHYPNVSCSREAVLNRIGQRLLADQIEDILKGTCFQKPLPHMERICPGACKGVKQVVLPKTAARAIPGFPTASGEVVDVMLVDQIGSPVLAIRITGLRHKDHEVIAAIKGVPWIAVKGSDILAQGTSWFVESSEGLDDCPDCLRIKAESARFNEEQRVKNQGKTAEIAKPQLSKEEIERVVPLLRSRIPADDGVGCFLCKWIHEDLEKNGHLTGQRDFPESGKYRHLKLEGMIGSGANPQGAAL